MEEAPPFTPSAPPSKTRLRLRSRLLVPGFAWRCGGSATPTAASSMPCGSLPIPDQVFAFKKFRRIQFLELNVISGKQGLKKSFVSFFVPPALWNK
jgi:hypothetical protein